MCGCTHASGDKESISGIQNTMGYQGCKIKVIHFPSLEQSYETFILKLGFLKLKWYP